MADDLVQIMELDPVDTRQGPDLPGTALQAEVFTGRSLDYPTRRVFGGQILAQSVMAAGRTVPATAAIHSLHGYFLLPGDPGTPIRFTVDGLRNGRSFFARRVDAAQHGQLMATVLASFQVPAAGPEHQDEPPALPQPSSLQPRYPFAATAGSPAHRHGPVLPVELRPVSSSLHAGAAQQRRVAATWLRVTAALPESPLLHSALLALLSDFSILRPALRAHGFAADRRRVKTASIDHSLWFHRACRADEWILYDLASPSAGGARALGTGRMFTAAGELVASSAQEGMLRVVGQVARPARASSRKG